MSYPNIVFVHNGTSYQLATLRDPALAPYRLRSCYLPDWDQQLIDNADAVIVADYLHYGLLEPHTAALRKVAERGGTLVVFAENQIEKWLPGYSYEMRYANFWAWRTGEDNGMRPVNTDSPYRDYFSEKALIWHQHGVITAPAGSCSLVELVDEACAANQQSAPGEKRKIVNGSTIIIDEVSTPGRILTTSMDPVHHHGSGFMPGATQLLYEAIRWASTPR